MAKSKHSAKRTREEIKHSQMTNARPISEIYPNVRSISISYSTSLDGAGGWEETPKQTHIYKPDDKTLFTYDCKNQECDGTFDLSSVVRDMILKHRTNHSDQYICQSNVNAHPCWVEYKYTIDIEYAL